MTQPPLVIPATVEVPQAEKTTLSNGATLYTRNGGTELWLTKKLGTLIVVR